MKKYLLNLSLLFVSVVSFAQNHIISGQVKTNDTHSELPNCSIAVLSEQDSLITGGTTDKNGAFNIAVSTGKYKLSISFVGYKNDTTGIKYIDSDMSFSTIYLSKYSKPIDNISVESEKEEIDKHVQIITDEIRIGTINTRDILNKIKGVNYDQVSNDIRVDNNNNIKLLINGVEKNISYVSNLSPDRLKKVEIIRNPEGRYRLEGYYALVNITLDNTYEGSEFLISEYALLNIKPRKDKFTYPLPLNQTAISYNYTRNKVNIYGAVALSINNFVVGSEIETFFKDGSNINVFDRELYPQANRLIGGTPINYTAGIDFHINPRHTISFEGTILQYPKNKKVDTHNFKSYVEKNEVRINDFFYDYKGTSESTSSNYSIFYIGNISDKDRLESNITYSKYDETYYNIYDQYKYTITKDKEEVFYRPEAGDDNFDHLRFNVEYIKDINDDFNTNFGYGFSRKQIYDSFKIDDGKYSGNYTQTDIIHRIYGSASYIFNDKISSRIGLAIERDNIINDYKDETYLTFQPLLDVEYKFNKKINLKFIYRTSSNYPSVFGTSPFPKIISERETNLNPSLIHKFFLRASAFQGMLTLEPYYYFSNNYVDVVEYFHNTKHFIFDYSYANLGLFEEKGVRVNFDIPIGKSFMWKNNLTMFSNKYSKPKYSIDKINDWSVFSQLIYTNQKNERTIQLNYQKMMTNRLTPTGFASINNDYWLALIQQPFLNKQLFVSLGYILPVDFGVKYNRRLHIENDVFLRYYDADVSILKNMILLKINYKLTKGKIKTIPKTKATSNPSTKGAIM